MVIMTSLMLRHQLVSNNQKQEDTHFEEEKGPRPSEWILISVEMHNRMCTILNSTMVNQSMEIDCKYRITNPEPTKFKLKTRAQIWDKIKPNMCPPPN